MTSKVDVQQVLKPCPWPDCSSQTVVDVKASSNSADYWVQAWVECVDCGSRGPLTCHYKGPVADAPKTLLKARSRAAELWNTRIEAQTISPATAEERDEQLRKAEAGMGILTIGHFWDAAALLSDAPRWAGMYQPLFDLSRPSASTDGDG